MAWREAEESPLRSSDGMVSLIPLGLISCGIEGNPDQLKTDKIEAVRDFLTDQPEKVETCHTDCGDTAH